MSLFIEMLSFEESSMLMESAKRSIIAVSIVAGLADYVWLRWGSRTDEVTAG